MRVSLSDVMRARLGLGIVFGMGSGLFVLHLIHALGEGEDLWTFLYGILIPLLFTVGLLIGGVWLWQTGIDATALLRISGWCLIGASALALATGLTILYEQAEGVRMSDRFFVIAGQASIGSVVGFIVGRSEVRHRHARAHAERLSEQLTVLNRVLRHDIRNEANVIQGRTELLTDQLEDQEQVETIRQKASKLVELGDHARAIERLLQQDREPEIVDIAAILETQLDQLIDTHPEIEIETAFPGEVRVSAHPLVESAIADVLDNAVEHNDKETPKIAVECSRVTDDGNTHVEIRIADNGPGIPDEELAVLERGYETPLEHTSGLGLWLVNWIVRESGGEVLFEENKPHGSIVCLRFEWVPAQSHTQVKSS